MAYMYCLDGIDIVYLFKAQAAATSVMVNRRKPNFQQSQKLQDVFNRRAFGGEL
ncbi:hypothetical protein [Photobacterium nomapromontoriensis]|uniref:hypothetical protein n=1 Tax=Photobacterium nomapromontoriensis TaxID=2910237 RepID=UPI003D0FC90B